MERLSSMDSSFLDMENSGPSIAVGGALIISGKAPTLAALRTHVKGRLDAMPRFRQRVETSRSKVRHSKWVEVEPDLTHHINQKRLKPGQSFDPVVSALMEVPMDRTRPLWDITLVTGYSTTEWCIIVRLHHSIADGQGSLILLGQLLDLDAAGKVRLADGISAMAAPRENTAQMEPENSVDAATAKAVKIIEETFQGLGKFIATYPDTVRSVLAMAPKAPSTLTGEVSSERLWVGRQYSLSEVKAARKAYKGVTINDMVLASVAYGFTKLLESRGEKTDGRTLRAVMPVSLRRDLQANNQVGILPAPLPLGKMDPAKRMKIIKGVTKSSKNSTLPVITETMRKATEKVTPAPLQEYVLKNLGTKGGYFTETLITNTPGPMIPLYFMGRQSIGSMPIIPIEGSVRLIVGITSFLNDLNVGITGDGKNAPDAAVLADGIIEGFEEIVAVAKVRSKSRGEKQGAAAASAAAKREAAAKKGRAAAAKPSSSKSAKVKSSTKAVASSAARKATKSKTAAQTKAATAKRTSAAARKGKGKA